MSSASRYSWRFSARLTACQQPHRLQLPCSHHLRWPDHLLQDYQVILVDTNSVLPPAILPTTDVDASYARFTAQGWTPGGSSGTSLATTTLPHFPRRCKAGGMRGCGHYLRRNVLCEVCGVEGGALVQGVHEQALRGGGCPGLPGGRQRHRSRAHLRPLLPARPRQLTGASRAACSPDNS